MNRPNLRLAVLLAALLAIPAVAAEPAKEAMHMAPAPPAFEHLKSLVGNWEGVGPGMEKGTTSFEVVANGSALVERLSPKADETMVNVYHPDGDAVVMTHYCGSGNQPRMRCTKDGSSLVFKMMDITNWKKGDMRMSAVTLVLVDADHMKQEWTSDTNGKSENFTLEFARKK
jgi:hypothetical protein